MVASLSQRLEHQARCQFEQIMVHLSNLDDSDDQEYLLDNLTTHLTQVIEEHKI